MTSADSSDDRFANAGQGSTPAGPSNASQDSAAYRDQLLKKLNCLIAVLEAAIAKVRRNMQSGSTDPGRLDRIRSNLENTLTICERAKVSLERRGTLPSNLPPEVSEAMGEKSGPIAAERGRRRADHVMTYRDYVELSSFEEFRKFRELPPISVEEIATCDVDRLSEAFGRDE